MELRIVPLVVVVVTEGKPWGNQLLKKAAQCLPRRMLRGRSNPWQILQNTVEGQQYKQSYIQGDGVGIDRGGRTRIDTVGHRPCVNKRN